jgi:hypothetical protein
MGYLGAASDFQLANKRQQRLLLRFDRLEFLPQLLIAEVEASDLVDHVEISESFPSTT